MKMRKIFEVFCVYVASYFADYVGFLKSLSLININSTPYRQSTEITDVYIKNPQFWIQVQPFSVYDRNDSIILNISPFDNILSFLDDMRLSLLIVRNDLYYWQLFCWKMYVR